MKLYLDIAWCRPFDEADKIFTALLALKTIELSEEIEEMLTLANELHDGKWEIVAMLKSLASELS